jgi:hypothetical protein
MVSEFEVDKLSHIFYSTVPSEQLLYKPHQASVPESGCCIADPPAHSHTRATSRFCSAAPSPIARAKSPACRRYVSDCSLSGRHIGHLNVTSTFSCLVTLGHLAVGFCSACRIFSVIRLIGLAITRSRACTSSTQDFASFAFGLVSAFDPTPAPWPFDRLCKAF